MPHSPSITNSFFDVSFPPLTSYPQLSRQLASIMRVNLADTPSWNAGLDLWKSWQNTNEIARPHQPSRWRRSGGVGSWREEMGRVVQLQSRQLTQIRRTRQSDSPPQAQFITDPLRLITNLFLLQISIKESNRFRIGLASRMELPEFCFSCILVLNQLRNIRHQEFESEGGCDIVEQKKNTVHRSGTVEDSMGEEVDETTSTRITGPCRCSHPAHPPNCLAQHNQPQRKPGDIKNWGNQRCEQISEAIA